MSRQSNFMATTINLPLNDTLINQLLKTWTNQLEEDLTRLADLQNEIAALQESIQLLQASLKTPQPAQAQKIPGLNGSTYHNEWTIFRKVLFFLQEKGQPLSTREIIELIIERQPHLKDQRQKLVSAVSGVLSAKVKDGKLKRKENYLGENAFYME